MPPVRQPESGPDGPFTPYRGNVWRMIEGQVRPATMRVVDTDAEQAVLEDILEAAKPPVPDPCQHLDYQFWSPFRYGRYPRASRFRRAGPTAGVWYGSEHPLAAVAESAWGALRFFAASKDTPMPRWPVAYTAVMADIQAGASIDLMRPEMAGQGKWADPVDYTDCLALADRVRVRGCQAIRYGSVRDPDHRANLAVLDCAAFAQSAPIARQTWHILLRPKLVRAHCETLRQRHMLVVGKTQFIHPGSAE